MTYVGTLPVVYSGVPRLPVGSGRVGTVFRTGYVMTLYSLAMTKGDDAQTLNKP